MSRQAFSLFVDRMARQISFTLLSRRSFLLFASALVVYNICGMYFSSGYGDLWEHLAAIHSFARNPVNPGNPYILADQPTHLFTPFHLLWGLMARVTGLHPFWLLPVVAGVNMFLFVASARAFSKSIFRDEKYALLLMLTMLFYWARPWGWSGFYNFGLLPYTAAYPYWFVLPVSLFVIAGYADARSIIPNVLYSLVAGLAFICHPLTGSFLILSLAIKVLTKPAMTMTERFSWLLMPSMALVVLVIIWPYFPVMNTIMGANTFSDKKFAGTWQMFYDKAAWRIWPAFLGIPFLIHQLFIRRVLSYTCLGLLAATSIYLLNYFFLHNSMLARYVIFVALYSQLGIVLSLQWMEGHRWRRHAAVAYVLLLLLLVPVQLYLSATCIGPLLDLATGTRYGTHSNVRAFRALSKFAKYIDESAVVMAPMEASWMLPGVVGCKVVGVGNSNPFMSDYAARISAVKNIFESREHANSKMKILSQYSANYVLVPAEQKMAVVALTDFLTVLHADENYTLYAVKR